jgi:putative ABC transport system substrate-binding protein
MMRRRTFVAGVAATAAPMLWPLVARAQQTKVPVIGFLLTTRERSGTVSAAFRSGLKDAGYVEGQNVEFRFGDDRALELQAREFVDLKVAAIVVLGGVDGLEAAAAATSRIPILYAGGADPVKLGLAASLNRPGGNITGITIILNDLVGKRLDLLLKLKPEVATVGYLIGDRAFGVGEVDQLMASARILKRQVIVVECGPDIGKLRGAFPMMVEQGAGAVIVGAFPIAFNNREEVIALVAEHRLPAIYAQRPYVYEGGLMSYFPGDALRQLAIKYVARILKGEKPGDLPIQQPTEYEFITNLRTAKALGNTIPYELQTLADKTIE